MVSPFQIKSPFVGDKKREEKRRRGKWIRKRRDKWSKGKKQDGGGGRIGGGNGGGVESRRSRSKRRSRNRRKWKKNINKIFFSYEIVWMEWPQIQQPFTQEELEFIKNIDPKEDLKYLKSKLKFREICLRNFRIAETVLKKCAQNGLTLYQIGIIKFA